MCRNQTTMGVKVSSSAAPKHHLNPYARPYNKAPRVYFVQPLLPLRYYYPHFQYTVYHKNNNDSPKQMVKNMYVQRCDPNRRSLPLKQLPRKVWRPKLKNRVAENIYAPVESAPSAPLFVHGDDDTQNTSVMMRNIPNQYSRDELMKFVDKCCAEHKLEYDFFYLPIDFRRDDLMEFIDKFCLENNMQYDFLYLPMDFKRHNNKGYAFINFTKASHARVFQDLMNGYKWGWVHLRNANFKSTKTCEIAWAKIQGKNGLVRHFSNSNFPCFTKKYLPVQLSPPRNGSSSPSTLTIVGRCLRGK